MQYFGIERSGGVAVCTMTNPPMNYLTGPMAQELGQVTEALADDRGVRAVILTGGVPGKFITHYSVDELAQLAVDADRYRQFGARGTAAFHALLARLQHLPKPVIAALNGDCMGGGFELALACDFPSGGVGAVSNRLAGESPRHSARWRRHAAADAPDRRGEGAGGHALRQRVSTRGCGAARARASRHPGA